MSAIFGVLDLKDNVRNSELKGKLIFNECRKYKIDKLEEYKDEKIYMGCGLQYIYPQSFNEILPYYDKEAELLITADVILDNRKELIEELEIKNSENISDSLLILQCYKKWGKKLVNYLIGDFTFAIWDGKELFIGRDHCGHRALYYYKDDNIFIFASTLDLMKVALKENKEINNKWVAAYLSNGFSLKNVDSNNTIYKNIFRFPHGSAMTISNNELEIRQYWYPIDEKELEFSSIEQGFEVFRNTLREAVECRVNSIGETSIMLSGGLDSSAVAAFAAINLEKEKKKLWAFTSVPFKDYVDKVNSNYIADEREYVKDILEKYKNIVIEYCSGEKETPITITKNVIENLEQPYLAIENASWILELCNKVSRKKCKVVLTGQFGNLSISYGDFFTNIKTLIDRKQYVKILIEARGIAKILNKSTIFVLRVINKFFKEDKNKNNYEDVLLNKEFYETFKKDLNHSNSKYKNFEAMKINRFENLMKTITGDIETVLGLNYGFVFRDPTKDKRIVELTLNLKHNYFVNNGKERYLVRTAMKDYIPEKIINNYKKRGIQGTDWTQKIIKRNNESKNSLEEIFEKEYLKEYINFYEIKKIMDNLDFNKLNENDLNLKKIIKIYILKDFLEYKF